MAAKILSAHHYLSKHAINTENIVKVSKACYLSAENSINVFVIVLQIVLFFVPLYLYSTVQYGSTFQQQTPPAAFPANLSTDHKFPKCSFFMKNIWLKGPEQMGLRWVQMDVRSN